MSVPRSMLASACCRFRVAVLLPPPSLNCVHDSIARRMMLIASMVLPCPSRTLATVFARLWQPGAIAPSVAVRSSNIDTAVVCIHDRICVMAIELRRDGPPAATTARIIISRSSGLPASASATLIAASASLMEERSLTIVSSNEAFSAGPKHTENLALTSAVQYSSHKHQARVSVTGRYQGDSIIAVCPIARMASLNVVDHHSCGKDCVACSSMQNVSNQM